MQKIPFKKSSWLYRDRGAHTHRGVTLSHLHLNLLKQTKIRERERERIVMDLNPTLNALIPSSTSVTMLLGFFTYLGIAGSIIPGKVVPGVTLSDRACLYYRCNGLLTLVLLVALLGIGVTLALYMAGCRSRDQGSSLKPHFTGNLIHNWWFAIQLNPLFMDIDLKFFFVRAGMMGWLLINLSVLAKCVQDSNLSQSMILYQLFCVLYILDYFFYEEYMTSTWDIIAENLGFMLVFGDLVCIPFTFSIQGWWLLSNKVKLTTAAVIANCIVFLIGGIARHCYYLGDLLLASCFSLPCGISSPVPYFYPIYLLILLIWRERRDEARCTEKYKEVWAEYCKLVPWRILPYVY